MHDVDAFREQTRASIGRHYSGPLHLAFTSLGALIGVGAALSQLAGVHGAELLVVPLALAFANLVEHQAHRALLHRERRFLGFLYRRHTLMHHRFFGGGRTAADSPRDWKLVMFPPPMILFFLGGIDVPASLLVAALSTVNAGLLFFATGAAYYLVYEWCHLAWHQPDSSLVGRLPVVRRWRAHHLAHHADPTIGFNVSFPLTDALLGPHRSKGVGQGS